MINQLLTLTLVLVSHPIHAQGRITGSDRVRPVIAQHGMVVAAEPISARIGRDVLARGGNAVDAAVTVGFVEAVTYPTAGNIGGGGFMVIHLAASGSTVAIDYREKAPSAAHRDMFLDEKGNADPKLSRDSHLASGVPGTVAGFALALERYGTLSLTEAVAPAIQLAEEGFPVSLSLSNSLRSREKKLKAWPATRAIFYKPNGTAYAQGDTLVQQDLATTLRRIAKQGVKGFYAGETAKLIVQEMQRHDGLVTRQDLADYAPIARTPIHGSYRGYDILSMPPPSSGGIHIVQILNILEGFNLEACGPNSAASIHLMAEAMKRAYADRATYLGDPDFFPVPIEGLTSRLYADELRAQISPNRRTPSSDIRAGHSPGYESPETTHFCVVDRDGNAVANTYTINHGYGTGIVVEGAGFLLNNEMDDFSSKSGVPNAFGLLGGRANAVEGNKRMLSSMSPTIVMKDGRPILVTGSPGGSRIITTTLQVILNVIDHGMNVQEAVNAPRVHHQWLPEELRVEEGLSPDTLVLLRKLGYNIVQARRIGNATSILINPGTGALHGAADPRRSGLAVGY